MINMFKIRRNLMLALLAGVHSQAFAQDKIQLDQTTVIDNHELPKVTYIVPWQAAKLPDLKQPPLETLIDDALEPLDRDVFRSQIQYFYEITPASEASAPSTGKTTK